MRTYGRPYTHTYALIFTKTKCYTSTCSYKTALPVHRIFNQRDDTQIKHVKPEFNSNRGKFYSQSQTSRFHLNSIRRTIVISAHIFTSKTLTESDTKQYLIVLCVMCGIWCFASSYWYTSIYIRLIGGRSLRAKDSLNI